MCSSMYHIVDLECTKSPRHRDTQTSTPNLRYQGGVHIEHKNIPLTFSQIFFIYVLGGSWNQAKEAEQAFQ